MRPVNPSAQRCHDVITGLCEQYLEHPRFRKDQDEDVGVVQEPIDESPQTQMNHVYSMMWPNLPALEADVMMQDDAWMEFLKDGMN